MALNLRIQTYQILTNNDEVCIPSLSSILLAVILGIYNFGHWQHPQALWVCWLLKSDRQIRNRPRCFDQVGHQMIGRHFFTISCQTNQNYEKMTIANENGAHFKKTKFSKNFIIKSWSPSLMFFTEKKSERFQGFLMLKNEFESTNFAIFEEIVHNFGRSDNDMI